MKYLSALLCGVAALALAATAQAQTFGSVASALNAPVTITASSGTNPVAWPVATGAGLKVYAVYCTFTLGGSYVGSAEPVEFSVLDSGNTNVLGQSVTAPSAGFITTAGQQNLLLTANGTSNVPFSGMASDEDGNMYLAIQPGDALQIRVRTALTGSTVGNCFEVGKKYQ
jgi:hypothetical protein